MDGSHRIALRLAPCLLVLLATLTLPTQVAVRADDAPASTLQAAMLRRASDHLRHGLQLAERRAVYAAHDQFVESLKTVAYKLDSDAGVSTHSRALAEGLSALEEADSFLASRAEVLTPAALASIMAGHRTKLTEGASQPPADMTALEAVERYLTIASEKLADASGHLPLASAALYGLGRVYALRSAQDSQRGLVLEQQAITLYRTALKVDANNYRAGNELGVLLYRSGLHEEALWTLLRSVSVSPESETAHNLFIVYNALGDAEGAAWAEVLQQSLATSNAGSPTVEANIGRGSALSLRWVDLEAFSNVANTGDFVEPAQAPGPITQQPEPKQLAGSSANKN